MQKDDLIFLYNQIEHIHEEVAKFLRNLKKDLDATLSYIENENIPQNQQLARTILQK